MNKRNKILTIQSQVAYGYVGNNIAKLAIELHGIDAIVIPTIILSSHTDYDEVYGDKVPAELFNDLIRGITAIKISDDISHIITGYYGSKDLILLSKDCICKLKTNQQCIYVCDPVMGDNGKLYVPEEVAQSIIEELIPLSDIIVPNYFELEYILQDKFNSPAKLLELIQQNQVLKDKVVILTNAIFSGTPNNMTETIIICNGKMKRILSEYVHARFVGTGDLFTSLFTSMIATGKSIEEAVTNSALYISKVLEYLKSQNCTEISTEALLKYYHMLAK